ncbi:MAG: Rpn family recombination-promoting nuclease/putative transposase [Holdemanella sp.]|nr:Rpn family recombination-promoting nuclease/putative transposase [Holdemanella sp.]
MKITKDTLFQILFNMGDEISRLSVISLIHNLIPEDISDLQFVNPNLKSNFLQGKNIILDCLLTDSNHLIGVEMQLKRSCEFENRALFYKARMEESVLKSGDGYNLYKKTYSIWFIDFILHDKGNYVNTTQFRYEDGTLFSDKETIILIELPKVNKVDENSSDLTCWCYVLNHYEKGKEDDKIKMIRDRIQSIDRTLKVGDEMETNDMNQLCKSIQEVQSIFDKRDAYFEGKAEGKTEGKQENRVEVAIGMLKEKLPLDLIVKISSLSMEKVLELQKTL